MRLWPRTMAAQLAALLLLGLVAAHAVGLSLVLGGGEAIHSISREQMVEHAVVAWRLGNLPSAQARPALAAASDSNARYALEDMPQLGQGAEEGVDQEIIAASLRHRLSLPADAIRVSLHEYDARHADLRIALRTAQGQWINSVQYPVMAQGWLRPLRFSVPVSTLPVLVIVFLFVRRILRPIKALAHAAERVSRGEQIAPLPVQGPAEAREVTIAFNLMQERLRRFVDDRTRMLAAISHDLRTPITSLRLRAELVDEPTLKAAMIRTLEEMQVMVEETMRFARDDAHNEDTREIDLCSLLLEIAQEQRAQAREILICEDHARARPYRCRPVSLKRALGNLVDNAVCYGRRARLRIAAGSGDTLLILVDDDGPGIAPDKLEEVFKPFVRLDPARGSPHGRQDGSASGNVGLGLAIARSCIEAHGGRLTLENRPPGPHPGGLRATISLPGSSLAQA